MSVINPNTQALATARQFNHTQEMLGRSLSRLSSGAKIVKPSDDAPGLARSEKLTGQSNRVEAASTNVQNAISSLQSADSFMGGITKALSRMSELSLFARDVTKNASDISQYQQEFSALQEQLRQTIGGTVAQIGGTAPITIPMGMFNGIKLFGNDAAVPPPGAGVIAIGDAAGQQMTIPQLNLRDGAMGALIHQDAAGNFDLNVSSATITSDVESALSEVFDERALVGAAQSRLEQVGATLTVQSENLAAAISRIRDVDVANESTQYAKHNIRSQAGTSMLAQANLIPQSALTLLQRN
ncbi:MAG TPA: flagellin [Opitutaceae bacterium]|nr:flagellin [Opitutaceae bacterium]